MIRARKYIRYSSNRQTEQSVEGQLRVCNDYIKSNGFVDTGEYIDRAITGKTDKRPEFQRMVEDGERGKFDVLIVYALDRFARNRYDSAMYKSRLKKGGVRIISATETITDSPEGIILESMLEGMAEYFSAELAKKTARGMAESARKCMATGRPLYGYLIDDAKHYDLDPKTFPAVAGSFDRYAGGMPSIEVVQWLDDSGYRTASGKKFTLNGLRVMLRNKRYTGVYIYNGIEIPGGMPAIVTDEIFAEVQRRLDKNKMSPARAKADEPYLLTGKLFCGKCGNTMVGESGHNRDRVYRYYKCSAQKKGDGCTKKPAPKNQIEDTVINAIVHDILLNDERIKTIAKNTAAMAKKERADSSHLNSLKAQLSDVESSIKNIMRAIEQGITTRSTGDRLRELEEQQVEIENALEIESVKLPEVYSDDVEYFIHGLAKAYDGSDEQKQRLVDVFVNKIFLYDDKIVIVFNTSDDNTREITLPEVEGICSDLDGKGEPKREQLTQCAGCSLFVSIFN